MIKSFIFTVLILGALSDLVVQSKKLYLMLNNEIKLPSFLPTDVISDFVVQVQSISVNDPTNTIKINLMEISDEASPLTSATSLASQDCIFVSGKCSVTFLPPKLNSAKKYTIRCTDQKTTRQIKATVQFTATSTNGNGGTSKIQKKQTLSMLLTPEGPTKPGFKFYAVAGTWNTNFKIASNPAPTVDQWVFKLWSVNGNSWNSESVQTISTGNSVSFMIGTAGYYILTVGIQVSAINAKTFYPIVTEFQFEDKDKRQTVITGSQSGVPTQMVSKEFQDKDKNQKIITQNETGILPQRVSIKSTDKVCPTWFICKKGTSICQIIVGRCSKKLTVKNDQPKKEESKIKPKGQDIIQIIEDFNNRNLKKY